MINNLSPTAQIAKALGDETRLRIMAMLEDTELCACQIIEIFALANSTVSKHLSILKQAGLLTSRKSGRWVYYAWPNNRDDHLLKLTQDWISQSLLNDAQRLRDHEQITKILAIDPEVLCRRQSSKNS